MDEPVPPIGCWHLESVVQHMLANAFDKEGLKARREEYSRFVQRSVRRFFNDDGTPRREIIPDARLPFWMFPALMRSGDGRIRELAGRMLVRAGAWDAFDVFITSMTAAILARHRDCLPKDIADLARGHVGRFTVVDGGRKPCMGNNDYVFHGYNDNMPTLATRTLILAGELLGRKDFTDQGLFFLEGLCAHFQRRGLLSEYNSGTYTALSVCCLTDIVELSSNGEAREMAAACANRIILDLLSHWHPELGTSVGSASRAYLPDVTAMLSILNAWMWFVTGDTRSINPIEMLDGPHTAPWPLHGGPNAAFCVAQFAELINGNYAYVKPCVVEYARAPRTYPQEVVATTDSGRTAELVTRTYSRPLWALGTCSAEMWGQMAGHHVTMRGVVARNARPQGWKDRVSFWHMLQAGERDLGDMVTAYGEQKNETTVFLCHGQHHTAQKAGTAMVLTQLGTKLLGERISSLKFVVPFSTYGVLPDEVAEDDTLLSRWEGDSTSKAWQFLRFGDVYVGVRTGAVLKGKQMPVRRCFKNNYMRVEVPIIENPQAPVMVDAEIRETLDIGLLVEVADREECGDFATFRRQCMQGTWECYSCFYRNSRYIGRHGELQIIDSVSSGAARFISVDGKVEQPEFFRATGMDEKLVNLFEDGRFIRQRRLVYRPEFVGSPFYQKNENILAADVEP